MKRQNKTILLIFFLTLIVTVAVLINVFLVSVERIHVRSMTNLDSYVDSVSTASETITAQRGNIYDANGEIVAQDVKTYDIICYLDSSRVAAGNKIAYVDDPEYTSSVLSEILDMDKETIYKYLSQKGLYQTELGPQGRNLSEETRDEIISNTSLHGIGFKESSKRVYPKLADFAPYLIGFAQSDENGKLIGKMGLELYLNDELSGTDGTHTYQMSKAGYVLPGMYEEYVKEENGYDVYTTIDYSIQEALEASFDDIQTVNNASKAWGAVVEINTGKILAWGQTPSFDPNVLNIEDYLNTGSQFAYEPGSVFKSIIYAAAIDMGVYDGNTTYDSSTYCYSSHGNTPYRTYSSDNFGCITNAAGKSWGTINFDYGLIYSSNVATMTLLEKYVGTKNYIDYVYNFGFFQEVDTDGIEEVKGVKNYYYPSEKLSLTYGQGSSVTMLQLLQAYTAIFGNGEMLKPYYIDKIVDSDTNEVIYQGERTVVSTPIKESTARQLQSILERVVSDKAGTAQYYAVDEVNIMAKTGTSEISLIGEGYNSDDSISSIMLAYPAENPQYMIYYAYISPYNYLNHLNSSVIKQLISKVAVLTRSNVEASRSERTYEKFIMPDITNMDIEDVMETVSSLPVDVVVIGDGTSVTGQYPISGSTVYSNAKVMLLTDGNSIALPDFTGWTRKEVINYWNLSGIKMTLNGYGIVKEQSMMPYSIVTSGCEVVLTLEDIRQNSEKAEAGEN